MAKQKAFCSYDGKDYSYPEIYNAVFGKDPNFAAFALDQLRIVEQRPDIPCKSEYVRYFSSLELTSGQKFGLNCRSWRCERCRAAWGRKWSEIIVEQLLYTEPTLLVNLTTAEMIDHEILQNALRRFIKAWRRAFGSTEYVKVVEYNKRHTQPHFHLIFICKDYVPERLPDWWYKLSQNQQRAYSWPEDTWDFISGMWREALNFYAPDLKPTIITWCQPPQNNQACARYAIGHITGKNRTDKNEEPDSSWKGRKLTYSENFFTSPTGKIWARILERWFPDRPKDPVFGLLVNTEECEKNGIPLHLLTPQVKQKLSLVDYWGKFGHLPPGLLPPPFEIVENDAGELIMDYTPGPVLVKKPRALGGSKTLAGIRAMQPDCASLVGNPAI